MKTKIAAILYLIVQSLIFGEILDGPANIRKEPNGEILYSVKDGEEIEVVECKEKEWYYVRLKKELYFSENDYVADYKIKKAANLFDENGKIIGKTVNSVEDYSMAGDIDSGNYIIHITGYTHIKNIKGLYVEEKKYEDIQNKINGRWINMKYDSAVKSKKSVYKVLSNDSSIENLTFLYNKEENNRIKNKSAYIGLKNGENQNFKLIFKGENRVGLSKSESNEGSDEIQLEYIPETDHLIIDGTEFAKCDTNYRGIDITGSYKIKENNKIIKINKDLTVENFEKFKLVDVAEMYSDNFPKFDLIIFIENKEEFTYKLFHWRWSKEGNLELYKVEYDETTEKCDENSKIGSKIYTLIPIKESGENEKKSEKKSKIEEVTYSNKKLGISWKIAKTIYKKFIFSENGEQITVNYIPDNKRIKEYPIALITKDKKSNWEKNKDTPADKIYENGSDVYTVLIGEIGENPYDEGSQEAEEYDEICRNLTDNISNLKINGVSAKFEK